MFFALYENFNLKDGWFMWLNSMINKKLLLQECSYGKGVFCDEDIDSDEEILHFGGMVVGIESLPQPYTPQNDYYLQIGENTFLGPSGGLDDFVNHACDPNSGVIIASGVVKLVAIVFIPAGSQITFDYSTTMDNFWWEMTCACGSEKCRRKVQNFVDLSGNIQAKYVRTGIVPGYILKKLSPKQFNIIEYGDALYESKPLSVNI